MCLYHIDVLSVILYALDLLGGFLNKFWCRFNCPLAHVYADEGTNQGGVFVWAETYFYNFATIFKVNILPVALVVIYAHK